MGSLNSPPQLTEFKHSNGKGGPNLKDRRKAMIEQIHFLKLTHTQKTRLRWKRRNAAMQRFYNLRAQMSVRYQTGPRYSPRAGAISFGLPSSPTEVAILKPNLMGIGGPRTNIRIVPICGTPPFEYGPGSLRGLGDEPNRLSIRLSRRNRSRPGAGSRTRGRPVSRPGGPFHFRNGGAVVGDGAPARWRLVAN